MFLQVLIGFTSHHVRSVEVMWQTLGLVEITGEVGEGSEPHAFLRLPSLVVRDCVVEH